MTKNSSADEEEDDETDEDDDEGCEDSSDEPSTQAPPQTPNDNRSRNMGSDKRVTPGRMVSSNPNIKTDEVIKILAVNRYFSIREVKVKHLTLAIKCHSDK